LSFEVQQDSMTKGWQIDTPNILEADIVTPI
jgi:hypothetical protein